MPRRRAVVLVTEGAAPELLERWGPDVLPAFARLRAEGASGTMHSELVPYEPPGLISAFTGHGPAEHGCFSYWDAHSPDYEPAVLDSSSPRRPLLWQRPELADLTTAVVNVFGSHPVRPLNGVSIGYPMRRTLHACHPRDLPVRLGRAGIHLAHDVNIWFTGQDKEEFTAKVLGADRARADAALHLFDGGQDERPDLLVLNLTAIDRLSHVYWQELEPGSPVPEEERSVRRAYRLADEVLGAFLDRADEHTEVFAFSEIGFGPLRAYCSVNEVLAAAGLLTQGPDGRPDWTATQAFEAVQGTQGVNLNTAGRYKHGIVEPHLRERTADRVREALLAHINPLTGLPLFAEVLRGEDVHSGPAAHRAPDLILVPYDWRYLPLGDTHWSAQVHRTLQSGWHRRESYWGGIGGSFGSGAGPDGRPLDVAPTVLRMLGRPPLPDLPGVPLGAG
ncbi:alkaline phosphatase family protein [Streptomyces sp. NPDC014894]|uniref:alkaline phosphatase family protein n=1 Tax=Streptomyces sp. NPDC014894 TaxID=3364931 RepID=UPI0036FE2E9E